MSVSVQPQRWQPTRLPRPWDSPDKNPGVACHFLLQCMKVKSVSEVTQSCLTLSDHMDCSLPGSAIHGIFQERVLEWGAIVFSASDTNYPELAQIPQVKGSVPQDCPHFSSLELLYFWPTGSITEVITIPLLTFNNFLECFTELRKVLCLARYSPWGCKGSDTTEWLSSAQQHFKGYSNNSETAMWKIAKTR